jgi:hypothetical protein
MPRPKLPTPTELAALRDDPVAFTRAILKRLDGQPAVLHPAQETLLTGIRRVTVAACGRQFGKSEGLGYYITWYATTKANKIIYIIAPTLDQARIIFNEVARHFRSSLKSAVQGKVVEYPFPKIILKNGTQIHARGANSPQYIRGKNAHLIICDEAAFFKDKTLTDVIQPMQTVTGKDADAALVLISTPFGDGAFKQFFEAAQHETQDAGQPTTRGTTPAQDAFAYALCAEQSWFQFPSSANPHADQKFLERTKRRYGEDSLLWRTEYLAEFADDELAVIPWAQIKWAYENYPGYDEATLPDFPLPVLPSHKYVQGADLANRSDYFVSAILDTSDPARLIFCEMTRYNRRGYAAIKQDIKDAHHRRNEAPTLVDATTLGESVVEELVALGVPAEGYRFTGSTAKYEVVQELCRLFAEHRLVIPYDPAILSELRYFQYDITPAGVVRMEAKRGHDDIVMALALAAHLALLPKEVGFFQAVEALDWVHAKKHEPPDTSHLPAYGVVTTSLEGLRRLGKGSTKVLDRSPQGYYDPFQHIDEDDWYAHTVDEGSTKPGEDLP